MPSAKIGFKLTNFSEFSDLLKSLPPAMEGQVVATAVNSAMAPLQYLAKQFAPVKTGALRRSITHTVIKYPGQGKVVGIMGPDRDYYEAGKRVKKGKSNAGADQPAKYAHLVEFGHYSRDPSLKGMSRNDKKEARLVAESAGAHVRYVAAKPFMRPAVDYGEGAAGDAFLDGMEKGQLQQLKKLATKLKKIS